MGVRWQFSRIICALLLHFVFASSLGILCPTKLPKPISVPIRNVTLNDGSLRRGAALSYGTPPQALAFIVDGASNNTYIYDGAAPCLNDGSRPQCSARFGGLFDESTSSTFKSYNNLTAPGLAPVRKSDSIGWYTSGTDALKVTFAVSLLNFPVGIIRTQGAFGAVPDTNTFGLSKSSALLNTMKSSGNIASNTFGFFVGWVGAQTKYQMDGNLILGGYDQAKITGDNVTLPIGYQNGCASGYVIAVTDITMNLKNGSNSSILGESQGSAIKACVEPDVDWISINADIWSPFVTISGVKEIGRWTGPINYQTMRVLASGAYDGGLTVTVYPNLQIRIPNHQLVVPNYGINQQGRTFITNSNIANILFLSPPDINDLPRFGKPFLSSAYLFVDNDKEEFSLWQSKATTERDLVAVGPPTCSPAPSSSSLVPLSSSLLPSSSSPAPPSSTTNPTSEPPTAPPETTTPIPNAPVSKGAIAGGVVGGLALIGMCSGAVNLLARRRKQQRQTLEQEYVARMEAMKKGSDNSYEKPEMPPDRQPPQEMPLTRDPAGALHEMPSDRQPPQELPLTRDPGGTLHEMPSTQVIRDMPHELPNMPRRRE
ncbi:MAG: hypothetical protein Q9217_004946 [Psora testacea]